VDRKGSQHLLNFAVLVVIIGATALTAVLLARTMRATDGINASLAGRLDATKKIGDDVVKVNQRLDTGIALDKELMTDTQNLLAQVVRTQHYSACTDRKLGGADDGHC
jgi:hypothetical protein